MGTRTGVALAAGSLGVVAEAKIKKFKARVPNLGARAFSFCVLLPFRSIRRSPLSVSILLALAIAVSAQDLEHLSSAVSTGNSEQKRDALFQIRNLRSETASRAAVPALRDGDAIVRATAAGSVVFLPKPEAVAVLVPLLDDRDAFVRKEAAYSLGIVGSAAAVVPLVRVLQSDKDLEVRAAAAVAVGTIGDRSAVEPLLVILRRRPSEDEEFLRRSAARSIGQVARASRGLGTGVVTPQNFLPEKYQAISGDELTVKHNIFSSAVSVLSSVLQNRRESDDARREAAFALGAIGGAAARGVLDAHRDSPDPYLAEIAREALLRIDAVERGQ